MSVSEMTVHLQRCAADVIEIGAYRGRGPDIARIVGEHGWPLPHFGRAANGRAASVDDGYVLSVRPDRWLMLSDSADPGVHAAAWQSACAGSGIAIDQSSGLSCLHFSGLQTREVLARSCRLDLDPDVFAPGSAAATIMVQVPVIIAALPSGLLLLPPSSTARHFHEWLASAARPFGLSVKSDTTLSAVLRSEFP